MDKTAIRNFAIEARKILMKSAITEAGFYGITKDGCKDPVQKGNDFEVYETVAGTENRIFRDDIKRRANLVTAIKEQGFDQVIEETAYTWFNRIIAIRFMEVNNYLPTRVRVLSSETGSTTPDIVTQSDTVELNLSSYELERIQTAKRENRYDDAFRSLFIKQCNNLNAILPGLFEKTDDYMELLLKITYTGDGVIRMLVDSIPEDNFNVETEGQVEIIGWMYQYYNTELKDDTFAKLKKNVKITKERIPAATQLFTPDWIVRYMVENSLGRVWIEHLRAVNPSVDEKAKAEEFGWKYYLPEAEQEDDVQAKLVEIRKSYKDLTPQDINCIDPCMGSGHILVYMFDVLMDIYRSEGFSERDAVFDVLEKNIRGLDIDRRAYQLSYFALMMKARSYNRIFFRGHEDIDGNRVQASPKVYAIEESNSIDRSVLQYYGAGMDEEQKNNALNQMNSLLDSLKDAKEYGSIVNIDNYDWNLLRMFLEQRNFEGQLSLFNYSASQSIIILSRILSVGENLAQGYHAVITNPPYMGFKGMGKKLGDFVNKKYPESKGDLSTVFMDRCCKLCKANGYYAMINIPVWMFLKTYYKLREKMLNASDFITMLHLGRGVFGSDFGTTAFVIRKSNNKNYKGTYFRLFEKQGAVDDISTKERWFFERKGEYSVAKTIFYGLPNYPIAYWASQNIVDAFGSKKLAEVAAVKKGMSTAADDTFIRAWYEVDKNKVNKKWFKVTKGGDFRKWYGNRSYYVNWENDGQALKSFPKAVLRNTQYYFKESICWNYITISKISFKYYEDFAFTAAAPCVQTKEDLLYILGFGNSCVANELIMLIGGATVTFEVGEVGNLPIIYSQKYREKIIQLVEENINISRDDWNSFEMSWDYKAHPLIRKVKLIEDAYNEWSDECEKRFHKLKNNEELLNRYFLEIYGLADEMDFTVHDDDITVRLADKSRDIRSFISYAVGCMFGRYSLDEEGLQYAGGEFREEIYKTYRVDADNIIPICDEDYFEDDITNRFIQFVSVVYGKQNLNENLMFIADALGNCNDNCVDVIRKYFLNDFYKDHVSIYSNNSGKKPIYWLFDSGKQNGFKCLVYMHRYTPDTVGLIRSDYLSKVQSTIENALKNTEYAINTSGSAVDRAQATKKRDKYVKQLAEIRAYYPALSHIALKRMELDLDDGVKANYAKFQGIEVSVEGEKKQKVDLLAKI